MGRSSRDKFEIVKDKDVNDEDVIRASAGKMRNFTPTNLMAS